MTPKMMLACKPCAAHLRARFKGLRTTLRRGLALIGAALLGGAATATELDYSGEVYCYEAVRDGSYKEYALDDASQRFRLRSSLSKFPSSDGTFHVAVPVTVRSGLMTSENVVISLEGTSYPGELSASKVYDDQTFMKMVCTADTSKWDDGDEYQWEYESGKEYRSWPAALWPDKKAVSGRYWVLAQLNGVEGNWSGLTHLRIEVRDDVKVSSVVVPIWRAHMVDLPGDKIFGGSSMAMKPLQKNMWVYFDDMPDGQVGIDYDIGMADKVGFQIDVREAGTLKVVYWSGVDNLQVEGRNIASSEDTQLNWSTRCLEVEVSAATTLTIYGTEEMCDVNIYEMSFWPSGSRCVRLAADYAEKCDDCGGAYLRGYVRGSGVYKSGETATLTAVAGKTAVFVRWESDEIELDQAASTNACLSISVPDSLCADAADRAEVCIRAVWRDRLPGEVGPAPSYAIVPGAQVSITVPDLVGYAAKGLPAGLKFDAKTGTISGAATKANTVATVTFTKKGAETFTTQIVVGSLPVLSVESNDAAGGKVTGAGAYAAGKKVTLKATPAKGYVFAGWYTDVPEVDDEYGEIYGEPLAGDVDHRTPTFPYVMGAEDATVYACFVTEARDDRISVFCCMPDEIPWDGWQELGFSEALRWSSLSLPTAKVSGLPAGLKYDAKTMKITGRPTKPGVYTCTLTLSNATVKNVVETFTITVPNLESDKIHGLDPNPDAYAFVAGVSLDASALAPWADDGYALKVSGLPAGLKYDAKTGMVTGVPTKSGTYTVTVTGTKRGEPTETATITVTVDGMPEAVAGTYVGHIDDGDLAGSFTLTATVAGKLTAKIVTAQGTVSFSAPSWSRVEGVRDEESDCREFILSTGDDKTRRALTVAIDADGNMTEGTYCDGNDGMFSIDAVKNVFSCKWYFVAEGEDGLWDLRSVPTAADADLTVTLKDGMATASGKIGGIKVSGSTVVRMAAKGLCVRLPAFVTVGGSKRLMDIDMCRQNNAVISGCATLVDER